MGEIDTKPIESVQSAISFFGQRNHDHRKDFPTKNQELENEREVENLEKELANLRVQIEAKDSAYKQALVKIDHHHQTANELSKLLSNSDLEKDLYITQSQEANIRINELESSLKRTAHELSESEKAQEKLLLVASDLELALFQLLSVEIELFLLREQMMDSSSRSREMERALNDEKRKTNELMGQVSEMNEAITCLKMRAVEVERENGDALSANEAELESTAKALFEANKTIQDLEDKLEEKSTCVNSLEVEIGQANELRISHEKVASDAISELNQLKDEMELHEKNNFNQSTYISLLETELQQLRTELGNAKAEAIENIKSKLEKIKEKENDAQIEIALLKSEIHKGRSKLAAAEAAEARAQGEKSALYNALQQMGLEAEETKKQNRMLKEAIKLADESKCSHVITEPPEEEEEEEADSQSSKTEESNEAKTEDQRNENSKDQLLENTKKELEHAISRIGEMRARAEQAISRAEAAEKAKAALEEQMKRRKEHKERRKAALAALREESFSRDFGNSTKIIEYDASAKNYQPLGKVLNMKF